MKTSRRLELMNVAQVALLDATHDLRCTKLVESALLLFKIIRMTIKHSEKETTLRTTGRVIVVPDTLMEEPKDSSN